MVSPEQQLNMAVGWQLTTHHTTWLFTIPSDQPGAPTQRASAQCLLLPTYSPTYLPTEEGNLGETKVPEPQLKNKPLGCPVLPSEGSAHQPPPALSAPSSDYTWPLALC